MLIEIKSLSFEQDFFIAKTFLENFLDASGIHGVNYLHSRNHCIGRLYWVSPRFFNLGTLGNYVLKSFCIIFLVHFFS